MITVVFGDIVTGGKSFYLRDFGLFGYPLAAYHKQSLLAGEMPLWNPLNYCGLPFLAQWNTMTLYPFSIIYLLFPLSWSLGVFCLLHLFLGAVGMHRLAKHWIGDDFAACIAGLVYGFNGLTWYSLMWPNNIAALGWMPWVVLASERAWLRGKRQCILAAWLGSMQMLSGAPEIIFITWGIVAMIWLYRLTQQTGMRIRIAVRHATVIVSIVLLCSAQLLPFLDLLLGSQRNSNYAGNEWSMPGTGWANFLVPLFYTQTSFQGLLSQVGQGWTFSYYLGIGTVALAINAVWCVRKPLVWILGAMLLVGLILSLGNYGYLYPAIKSAVPQLGFMRYPIKFVVIAVFTLPLLAAFGASALNTKSEASPWKHIVSITILICIIITAILFFAKANPASDLTWSVTMQNGLWRAVFLALIVGVLILMSTRFTYSTSIRPTVLGMIVLIVFWMDLFTHTPELAPRVNRWVYGSGLIRQKHEWPETLGPGYSRAMITQVADEQMMWKTLDDADSEFLARRLALSGNFNILDNVPKLGGVYSLYLPRMTDILGLIKAHLPTQTARLQDFLGISHIPTAQSALEWEERSSWMPMVSTGQAPVYYTEKAVLRGLLDDDFDPRHQVFLPAAQKVHISVTNQTQARVTSVDYNPQRLEIDVHAESPSLLVIAQSYHHAWQASVNDAPVPLLVANHAFQALEIPAGTSHVVLAYRDRKFQIGCLLSLVSVAGSILLWYRINPSRTI